MSLLFNEPAIAFYDSTKKGVGVHLSLKTILLIHSIPDVLKINLEDGEKMLKNCNDILIGQMFGHFNGFLCNVRIHLGINYSVSNKTKQNE